MHFLIKLGLAISHVTHEASMTQKEHRKHLQSPPPAMAAAQVSGLRDGGGGVQTRVLWDNGGFNLFNLGFLTLLSVQLFLLIMLPC